MEKIKRYLVIYNKRSDSDQTNFNHKIILGKSKGDIFDQIDKDKTIIGDINRNVDIINIINLEK